ncbi:citramalate synthase [Quadrisphaera sp. DSM 44207]|uniref:citramalate synthase n=1 Tax=Quadrisphaera sp. DSM 44207 TaxID=1881057 RepID=UPI000883558B|nr:citramalate synthase [Quadrisphaera sp. DSM 44207]SDQ74920.1 2-isopropylmalate synthase [Quadrisphaera sp. DSM 44207]
MSAPAPGDPAVHVYDTTLRDGAQQEGLSLSVADKLAIARHLDELGVHFVEGGWPGANPKDTEFFARAAAELTWRSAQLAAFGATRRPGVRAADDPQVRALLDAATPVVTLVAKSHSRHVELALRTTCAENLAMVTDTVALLVAEGRRVFVDAEHFFDGHRADPAYAREVVLAAAGAGAEVVVLCDTNGGMLPHQVSAAVADVLAATGARLGIHAHNDSGCAVANSLAAVQAGASHVQGCVNGYGERTGNADLVTVVADLVLKLDQPVLDRRHLREATRVAHQISEITNVAPYARAPYVGASAFAHKAGLHASAIRVDPDLYQHTDPTAVGNDMRMLVSDMAGRASIELKGRELGVDLAGRDDVLARTTARVKELEQQGWTFEAADASFELLLREELEGARPSWFEVESWRALTEHGRGSGPTSEATVKLVAGGARVVCTGEGNGPVNALDAALRQALLPIYPELAELELTDFRVRILDADQGTDATTRVLIDTTDGQSTWTTVGVAPNLVEASWQALVDSLGYGLLRAGVQPR